MKSMEVNIHEAKTQFSRLIRRVEAGEEITISRAGKPVAKLISAGPQGKQRPLGIAKGEFWISDDFDAPDPEVEALFYDAPLMAMPDRKGNHKPKKSKKTRTKS